MRTRTSDLQALLGSRTAAENGTPFIAKRPVLGILGGQGALASAVFHTRLLLSWSRHHACTSDASYPEVMHLSRALPGLGLAGVQDPTAVAVHLRNTLVQLHDLGAKKVAVVCNSLAEVAREPASQLGMSVLNPWTSAIKRQGGNPYLVLCSASQRQVMARGVVPALWQGTTPAQQSRVDASIAAVVRGDLQEAQRALTPVLQQALARKQAVLLACTELACLPEDGPSGLVVHDGMDDLVADTVEWLDEWTPA